MLKASRSLLVMLKSMRPLYCASVRELGVAVLTSKMVATGLAGFRPPPTPGSALLTQDGSEVPRGVVRGVPRANPWPGIVMQLPLPVTALYSTKPMPVQLVALLLMIAE